MLCFYFQVYCEPMLFWTEKQHDTIGWLYLHVTVAPCPGLVMLRFMLKSRMSMTILQARRNQSITRVYWRIVKRAPLSLNYRRQIRIQIVIIRSHIPSAPATHRDSLPSTQILVSISSFLLFVLHNSCIGLEYSTCTKVRSIIELKSAKGSNGALWWP